MLQERPEYDAIRGQCWDEAVYTFGTAYIFEQRANNYRKRLRLLQFLGLFVPLTIGSIYLSFNSLQWLLSVSLIIAGVMGTIQLIASAWSLSSRWEETYSYALESLAANYHLADRFEKIGKNPPSKLDELKMQFGLLEAENSFRTIQDNKHGLTDKEKRKGMRAALRKFQRPCASCDKVPTSMKPTDCDICGNF